MNLDTRDSWQRQADQARVWNEGAGELVAHYRNPTLEQRNQWALEAMQAHGFQDNWFIGSWQSIAAYLTRQTVEDMLERSMEREFGTDWLELAKDIVTP